MLLNEDLFELKKLDDTVLVQNLNKESIILEKLFFNIVVKESRLI